MVNLPAGDARAQAAIEAIRTGDVERLRKQLDADPDLAQSRIVDHKGVARTLLHVATDWPGHFPNAADTVSTLVAAGAEVNAPVVGGNAPETPLHWAASSDDVAVLDALLDGGADIEASGAIFTGGSPMSDAVVFAQWRAARRLLDRGATTTFWQAAGLGLLDSVRREASGDSAPSADQLTNAFWHACRGGQQSVAEYLLERGADMNWVGYDSRTPLDAARESGSAPLVAWLESRGALAGPRRR